MDSTMTTYTPLPTGFSQKDALPEKIRNGDNAWVATVSHSPVLVDTRNACAQLLDRREKILLL